MSALTHQPATLEEIVLHNSRDIQELKKGVTTIVQILGHTATKADLKHMATKADLQALETRFDTLETKVDTIIKLLDK